MKESGNQMRPLQVQPTHKGLIKMNYLDDRSLILGPGGQTVKGEASKPLQRSAADDERTCEVKEKRITKGKNRL